MAKVSFNGNQRIIDVLPGVTVLDVQEDLYSEWKEWVAIGDNSKYAPAYRTFGGDPTIENQTAPRYYFLLNGWRIHVDNLNLVVGTNLYTSEGDSPFVLDNNASVSLSNSDVPVVEEATRESLDYGGHIVYDVTSPYSGTAYPVGTRAQPVNNLTDAIAIGAIRNIDSIHLESNIVLDQDVYGFSFFSHTGTRAIIGNGFKLEQCAIERCTVTGDFGDSEFVVKESLVTNISNFSGILNDCAIIGRVLIRKNDRLTVAHCYPILDIGLPCIFDMNPGETTTLNIQSWSGDITVQNIDTPGDFASLNLTSGNVTLDSTVTNGMVKLRGLIHLNDMSGGGVNLDYDGLVETIWIKQILGLSQQNYRVLDTVHDSEGCLTQSKVRIYATAADANADTNHISEYQMNATWSGGLMTDYKMVQL